MKVLPMRGPLSLLGMIAAALAVSSSVHAQTFSTASTSTDAAGDPVKAEATFHVTTNNVHVDLWNLIVNQNDVGQNISDLFFTVSSAQSTGNLTGSSGASGTVASDGTFTSGGILTPTRWQLQAYDATFGFHLNDLGFGQPKQTILGSPNPITGKYSANSSIAGNDPHNPFLVGDVSFDVAISGLSAGDFVNSATFSFGTTAGDNVRGTLNPAVTPEGDSLLPVSSGLLPLGGLGLWHRRRRNLRKSGLLGRTGTRTAAQ